METNYNIIRNDKTFKYIHFGYIVLIACITAYLLIENPSSWLPISLLIVLFSVTLLFRHLKKIKSKKWLLISPYIELAIALPLSFYTQSAVALWLILLINIDVIIDYSTKYSGIFSIAGYLAYIVIYLIKLNSTDIIQFLMVLLVSAVQYTIIMSVGFIAKRFYIQNIKYKELMARQKVQMFKLEQMAVIKERNRMAGEIHDSVGHQLTTALVQLEATSVLIDKDVEQAKRRLTIIKDQIKLGLNELRNSVSELKADVFENFENSLNELCKRLKDTTSIEVEKNFTGIDNIYAGYQRTIYNMIMEAMTNAIKHGRCSKILLDVICTEKEITVRIINNGVLPDSIKPGFGLSKMKNRIETLNGLLKNYKSKDGFTIEAKIPTTME